MNQILVDVYLNHILPKRRLKLAKLYHLVKEKDIEEIILGDVALRDKQREEYTESEFKKNLNKIIKNYK